MRTREQWQREGDESMHQSDDATKHRLGAAGQLDWPASLAECVSVGGVVVPALSIPWTACLAALAAWLMAVPRPGGRAREGKQSQSQDAQRPG